MEQHDTAIIENIKPPEPQRKITLPKITKKGLVITFFVLLIIAGTIFSIVTQMASDTLPGDKLYNFKTAVVEEIIAATKLSSQAKSDYAVSRLESRLRELQLLAADTSTSSDETLNHISSLTERHVAVVQQNVIESQSLSAENKIDALAKVVAITRAQEILIDETAEFALMSGVINAAEGFADNALRTTINTFASSTDDAILVSYLQRQVGEVAEKLPQVANGSRAQTLALRRIDDTNEAILDNQFAEAIYFIFKAKEAIAVDQYLYAAERGYVEGVTPEAGPIPEGN